ncbi:MAG TPA: NapC/NirT family cytochrome c [Ignavibacteriaceae bacterium]|nr:NapC/NirT family cytochrome c [Ignavibacteriaceae bacterium]
MARKRLPSSVYNPVTLSGAALAALSFGLILFLMLLDSLSAEHKPYVGIIAFVILPGFLIIGLILIAVGVIREHKREKKGKIHKTFLPVIDFNNPRHRRVIIIFSSGTILLLLFTAFGSFKAYEYTDSDAFCGTVCHKVMEPEYTAYQFSPHARVGCVQCHIGPGADWFVRSKFSGTYQVYAVLFNKYPKPIPTPIENLRPAQETCEQCHWPKNFFSEKLHQNTYYLSDESNTKWTLDLLIKIGGGNIETGPTSGIHWHMNIANEVTYAAVDSQRLIIPWVKVKHGDGHVSIYRSTEISFDEEKFPQKDFRRMDCIDCHNRPSHIYNPPERSVNPIMALNWIDPKLPYIKSLSIDVLENSYSTKPEALDKIKILMRNFYEDNYPETAVAKKQSIDRAINEVQKIYTRNYFPEMKVSWKKFPEHIGHLYAPGCFRCHDGKHVNEEGKVLTKDCNTCHTILAQKFENDTVRVALEGVKYRHPVDIGNAWMEMNCSDCHGS